MISIFIATSGRPAMFRDMLESLKRTTFGYDIEIVAAIDDDLMANDYAAEYDVEVDYSHVRRGALNAWNRAFEMCSGDLLVPAGDDQIFHNDWLMHALTTFEVKLESYGVLGMNDLAYNGNIQVATMFMFDRQYCIDYMGGVFAPPPYRYYCIDLEWWEKARMLDLYYWEERSVVEHLHSAHNKRPVDTTDSYKEDKWMEIDNATFEDRKSRGFPIEWESLI